MGETVWAYEPLQLTLVDPFEVAHGRSKARRSLILTLSQDGMTGFGEAPEIGYAGVDLAMMTQKLEARSESLQKLMDIASPADRWCDTAALFGDCMPLVAALDAAGWDLWARQHETTVWSALGLPDPKGASSCWTLGIDSPERMLQKLGAQPGWPAYKIKLGGGNAWQDLDTLRRLRGATEAPFWVDANTGWSSEETIQLAERFVDLGVVFIEQPLPPDQDPGLKTWVADCPLPVVADESCQTQQDVQRCHDAGYAGVNVKPAKCGGLTPAADMLRQARGLGMRTMIGCMIESPVGISAVAQLAGLADEADLDGSTLIEPTIYAGVRLKKGRAVFPGGHGLGINRRR